ncbi:MAG: hypothetical protein RIS72_787, partial [Pseudomonadota bacterium]
VHLIRERETLQDTFKGERLVK